MSTYRQQQDRGSILPHDRVLHDDSVLVAARLPRRLVSKWGKVIFQVLAIAAAVLGLTRFAFRVSSKGQMLGATDRNVEGVLVHVDVHRVWLPSGLIALTNGELSIGVLRTHDDLRRHLELRGQENLWYAMIVRGYHSDGLIDDIPIVHRPYSEPQWFPELLEILALAAGNVPRAPNGWFSTTAVSLLPESFLKRDPRDAVLDLPIDAEPSVNAESIR
jgi:hypothetical protein